MPNALYSVWNDDVLVQRLTVLWADGKSCQQIACELSAPGIRISRSAVIGKVNRLGLDPRQSGEHLTLEQKLLRNRMRLTERSRIAKAKRAAAAALRGPNTPHKAGKAMTQITYDKARMIPLLDLEWGECRFPFGDGSAERPYRFCALPATQGSYCEHCFQVATEPRAVRIAQQPKLGVAA